MLRYKTEFNILKTDLAGRVVAVLSAGEGSCATVNVAPGIYVAAGKKVLVR